MVATAAVLLVAPGAGAPAGAQEMCLDRPATIAGTSGDDAILGTGGADVIAAGGGNDLVQSLGGDDVVCGGDGNDVLSGGPGSDRLSGGAGADTLIGDLVQSLLVQPGDDELRGDAGGDTASYVFSLSPVRASLAAGRATGEGTDRLVEVESLTGSNFDDVLTGDGGDNVLQGCDGDDALDGAGGRFDAVSFIGLGHDCGAARRGATVDLAAGRATGAGRDVLRGIESVTGSDHDDTVAGSDAANTFAGLGGNDTFRGRGTGDLVLYAASPGPVTVDLAAGSATGEGRDRLSGIDLVGGSRHDDVLRGSARGNGLFGHLGADRLEGGAGDDFLFGDSDGDPPAADRLLGGAGDDLLTGGPGDDTLDGGPGAEDGAGYIDAPRSVRVDLSARSATGDGADRLVGVEGVAGSAHADVLLGDGGPNLLLGLAGDDRIAAGAGDDFIRTDAGDDAVDAGAGRDYCLDTTRRGCEIVGVPDAPSTAPAARTGHAAYTASGTAAASSTAARVLLEALRSPIPVRRCTASGCSLRLRAGLAAPLPPSAAESPAAGPAPRDDRGRPTCGGSPQQTGPRALSGALRGAARRFTSAIAPPKRVRSQRAGGRVLTGAAAAPAALAGDVSWRGVLYALRGGRWRPVRRTPWATASTASGAPLWSDARGRPYRPARVSVGPGQYAWKGELRYAGRRAGTLDWAEPHVTRGRGGRFQKSCRFGR